MLPAPSETVAASIAHRQSAAHRCTDARVDRASALRRGAPRSAVRAARLGRHAAAPGHDRLDSHRQGLELRAQERFNAIRGAITTMRRAYPQFLAAGGEDLPPDVLQIIYPLDYWPLIQEMLAGSTRWIRISSRR